MNEENTKLLLKVATYMAQTGVVDISYRELQEIIEEMESNNDKDEEDFKGGLF